MQSKMSRICIYLTRQRYYWSILPQKPHLSSFSMMQNFAQNVLAVVAIPHHSLFVNLHAWCRVDVLPFFYKLISQNSRKWFPVLSFTQKTDNARVYLDFKWYSCGLATRYCKKTLHVTRWTLTDTQRFAFIALHRVAQRTKTKPKDQPRSTKKIVHHALRIVGNGTVAVSWHPASKCLLWSMVLRFHCNIFLFASIHSRQAKQAEPAFNQLFLRP
jgi:hypothetical protein